MFWRQVMLGHTRKRESWNIRLDVMLWFQVSNSLSRLYSEMIFDKGFVHCDPHPGNVLVNKNSQGKLQLVLLDHGLYTVSIFVYFLLLISLHVFFLLA